MDNAEVIQDFRRRWEHSFVWLYMDKTNEETLVYLNQVEDSRDKMATLTVTSQRYGTLVLNFGSPDHELRFKYPPVGVFQCGPDALMYRRRPARQYRRGICPDNSVLRGVVQGIYPQRVRFEAAQIQAAFDHKTYTKEEALNLLTNSKVRGAAMSDNYSLTLGFEKLDQLVLWHWDNPIAFVDTKGQVTRLLEDKYKLWVPEEFKLEQRS